MFVWQENFIKILEILSFFFYKVCVRERVNKLNLFKKKRKKKRLTTKSIYEKEVKEQN